MVIFTIVPWETYFASGLDLRNSVVTRWDTAPQVVYEQYWHNGLSLAWSGQPGRQYKSIRDRNLLLLIHFNGLNLANLILCGNRTNLIMWQTHAEKIFFCTNTKTFWSTANCLVYIFHWNFLQSFTIMFCSSDIQKIAFCNWCICYRSGRGIS